MRLVRHAAELLAWGWQNGRRESLVALGIAIAAYGASWFVSSWLVPAIWFGALIYTVAWGRGHRRGFDASQAIQLDGVIEMMEQICAHYEEHLAPHHPEREAAARHLAHLRHVREKVR